MARTLEKMKGRKTSGTFLLIPTAVVQSPAYRQLSLKARALILDMGSQFNGHNNGDQSCTWQCMQAQGWKSKDTMQRARDELLTAGFIERTKQGGLGIGPSLYAFTWRPIDDCGGKLDVRPTNVASNLWKQPQRFPKAARKQNASPTIGAASP